MGFFTARYEALSAAGFNGSSSQIGFGTAPPTATFQSCLALVYPSGSGGGGTSGAIWSRFNGTTGQRFYVDYSGANPNLGFVGSSATNNRPFRSGTTVITTGSWWHLAFTWSASILASNILLYAGKGGAPLSGPMTTQQSGDGTAPVNDSSANSFAIGNMTGLTRNWNGSIVYVARWNRVLTLSELQQAQRLGPISVPQGLILCWANGRDYGPYGVAATSAVDITAGLATQPINQRLLMRPMRKSWLGVGGAVPTPSASSWFLMQ